VYADQREEGDGTVDCCGGMVFGEWVGGGENERLGSFSAKVTCWNSWGEGGFCCPVDKHQPTYTRAHIGIVGRNKRKRAKYGVIGSGIAFGRGEGV